VSLCCVYRFVMPQHRVCCAAVGVASPIAVRKVVTRAMRSPGIKNRAHQRGEQSYSIRGIWLLDVGNKFGQHGEKGLSRCFILVYPLCYVMLNTNEVSQPNTTF